MKIFASFVMGFLFATALFFSLPVRADNEPRIVGDNGYVSGVDVFTEKGERICTGPYYDKTEKTLECKY